MSLKSEKNISFLIVFLLLMVSYGCASLGSGSNNNNNNSNNNSDKTQEELEKKEATVTLWHSLDKSEVIVLEEIIEQFNKQYPKIKVELSYKGKPNQLRNAIVESIRVNSTPTIAQMFTGNTCFYSEKDVLTDLTDYKNHKLYGLSSEQLNDYVDETFENNKYEVPLTRNMEVMYFNASWFDEHGLLEKYNLGEIVNDEFVRNENASLTWDDIAEIGQYYITTDEYTSLAYFNKADNYLFSADSTDNLFIQLIKQWGSEYLTFEHLSNNEYDFNNDTAKKAIEWYLNGHEAGYFVTASAWNLTYSSTKFTSEKVKMMVGSSRGYSYNEASDQFVLGVLPYPQKETDENATGKNCAILESSGLSLFKCANEEEELAGWLFLKYLTTWHEELAYEDQPTVIWSEKTGCLPSLKSLENHKEFKNFLKENTTVSKVLAVSYEQIGYKYQEPNLYKAYACKQYVGLIIDNVLYWDKSVDEAFKNTMSNLS